VLCESTFSELCWQIQHADSLYLPCPFHAFSLFCVRTVFPVCCAQTPLNRRKSAAPEMFLGVNDDEKEKENLRSQNSDTPTAAAGNSFTPFKKMLDRCDIKERACAQTLFRARESVSTCERARWRGRAWVCAGRLRAEEASQFIDMPDLLVCGCMHACACFCKTGVFDTSMLLLLLFSAIARCFAVIVSLRPYLCLRPCQYLCACDCALLGICLLFFFIAHSKHTSSRREHTPSQSPNQTPAARTL